MAHRISIEEVISNATAPSAGRAKPLPIDYLVKSPSPDLARPCLPRLFLWSFISFQPY